MLTSITQNITPGDFTTVAPGDKSELKAGTPIIIMASEKGPDGTVTAKTPRADRGFIQPQIVFAQGVFHA